MDTKLSEWRPNECGTRLGDFIALGSEKFLKVKCRRCSKVWDKDVFHFVRVDDSCQTFSSYPSSQS